MAVELDTERRVVTVPDDFAAALAANPSARTTFERLSYSHQLQYVDWITETRRDETRSRRIDQAVVLLEQGKTPR